MSVHLIWGVECSFATVGGHKLLTAIRLAYNHKAPNSSLSQPVITSYHIQSSLCTMWDFQFTVHLPSDDCSNSVQ